MVVLIEDEPILRASLATHLRTRGYTVRECANAAAAVPHILDQAPLVLVLDLMTPEMDGLSLLKFMAEYPYLESIPVIVATALPEPLPAFPRPVEVLKKPFAVQELVDAIMRLAPLVESEK